MDVQEYFTFKCFPLFFSLKTCQDCNDYWYKNRKMNIAHWSKLDFYIDVYHQYSYVRPTLVYQIIMQNEIKCAGWKIPKINKACRMENFKNWIKYAGWNKRVLRLEQYNWKDIVLMNIFSHLLLRLVELRELFRRRSFCYRS